MDLPKFLRPRDATGFRSRSLVPALLFIGLIAFSGFFFSGLGTSATHRVCDYANPAAAATSRNHWVHTWHTVPEHELYKTSTAEPFSELEKAFQNTTLRMTVQITLGAQHFRLRFSNWGNAAPLPVEKITAAVAARDYSIGEPGHLGSRLIDPNTLKKVTVGGSENFVIPEGAMMVTDPISFDQPLKNAEVLTVTMYIKEGSKTDEITFHKGSGTTTHMVFGDQTEFENVTTEASRNLWYFLSGVEAWKESKFGSLVVLGDSITSGSGSDTNQNNRWPSLLFNRMQESELTSVREVSVANSGSPGNQVMESKRTINALARVERDVLAQSGLRYALIFEGVNDVGHGHGTTEFKTEGLIAYYKQMITRIHTHGVPVFGGTITPVGCWDHRWTSYNEPHKEEVRLRVNDWIRNSGWFDAVIDFDAAVRDPGNHTIFAKEYENGDCLHPSPAGHAALAAAVPLDIFEKHKLGVDSFGLNTYRPNP